MKTRSKLLLLILVVLSGLATQASARERKVHSIKMVNHYGFDAWNINGVGCKRISRPFARKLKRCVNQGTSFTRGGNLQYKCRLRNKSEIIIYTSKRICKKQYQSMYVEAY